MHDIYHVIIIYLVSKPELKVLLILSKKQNLRMLKKRTEFLVTPSDLTFCFNTDFFFSFLSVFRKIHVSLHVILRHIE